MSVDLASIQSQLQAKTGNSEKAKEQAMMRQQQEMKMNSIMHQLCTPEALERCLLFLWLYSFLNCVIFLFLILVNRIGLVKPEQKAAVEEMILRTSRGRARKVDEDDIVQMLQAVSDAQPEVKVTIKRRATDFDDLDDEEEEEQ